MIFTRIDDVGDSTSRPQDAYTVGLFNAQTIANPSTIPVSLSNRREISTLVVALFVERIPIEKKGILGKFGEFLS